jgi:hypothetical protein
MTLLLGALTLVLACLVARRLPPSTTERCAALLDQRWTAPLLGVVTLVGLCWVGGGALRMTPISTDENAYLLEARLVAQGRVVGAPAPIPDFFEQPWVMVTPATYGKYPPGQALTLAPGVALGLPWLMPALLVVLMGTLVFALARRLIGGGGALLVWAGWTLTPMVIAWQSSYFSEITTGAMWLVTLWAAWRWSDDGGGRWLSVAALALGWAAITRPYTALLLALPLAIALLPAIRRRRAWRDLVQALAVGTVIVAILPAWNVATTGAWDVSGVARYTATYLPWDRLGFAIDSTPPLRAPAADFAPIAANLLRIHHAHTLTELPATLAARTLWVMRMTWTGWRALLIPFALLGLGVVGRRGWIAVGSAAVLLLGYLVWGHDPHWTLYYAETTPALFLAAGAGIAWCAKRAWGALGGEVLATAVLLALPVLIVLSVRDAAGYRSIRQARAGATDAFEALIRSEPGRTIWFVREAPDPTGQAVLIANDPDWERAPQWIVHDLGPRNAELLRFAPDRAAWLVDRVSGRVSPISRPVPGETPIRHQ